MMTNPNPHTARFVDEADLLQAHCKPTGLFWHEIYKKNASYFFSNIQTRLAFIEAQEFLFPITINESELNNSYTLSPYTYYILCAEQEVQKITTAFKRKSFLSLLSLLKPLLKWSQINQCVGFNNTFFATNLYPPLQQETVDNILKIITQKFPTHTIIFRSLDSIATPTLMDHLKKAGCLLIPQRLVYHLDPNNPEYIKSRMFKSDAKLIENSPYTLEQGENLTEFDLERMSYLYRLLYTDKHNPWSPQITPHLLQHAIATNYMKPIVLKKNDTIDAMALTIAMENRATPAIIGYDTTLPQEVGLYRQLNYHIVQQAAKNKQLLHLSAGAGSFKKLRRATPVVEYMAVFTKHLPPRQRSLWKTLQFLMNHFGLQLIQSHGER